MSETTSGQGAERSAPPSRGAPRVDELAPGGPRAKARGCLCSVLANAAYRAGGVEDPCIDPRCPMHTAPGSPGGGAPDRLG